jgi:hemoglobin
LFRDCSFSMELHDIKTQEDIRLLVDVFYGHVMKDEILKGFFETMNFEEHKPRMIHFWSFVLLDETGYTTNVFDKHVHMHLEKHHFDRWMNIFESTVRSLFQGEKADMAIFRAKTISWTFSEKFKKLNEGH